MLSSDSILAGILAKMEEQSRVRPGSKYSEDWMDQCEEIMEQLGATGLTLEFSGGNDSGQMDSCTMVVNGRTHDINEVGEREIGWTPIGEANRPVSYNTLLHPRQRLINELIEAAWIPIGREHGGFATDGTAYVSGSVEIDLTAPEDDEWARFKFHPGEWTTVDYCIRCSEEEVEEEGDTCDNCATKTWCTECDFYDSNEATGPDGLCDECRENPSESTGST